MLQHAALPKTVESAEGNHRAVQIGRTHMRLLHGAKNAALLAEGLGQVVLRTGEEPQ